MPSIRQIAARAGYSKSTVSLVMQASSRIPEATRNHVLAVARELDYHANPVFAQMMRSVRKAKPLRTKATIGILHGFAEARPAQSIPYHAEWMEGARERAMQLGFATDELWMHAPRMSAQRLSRVILARGINAVLIAPLPPECPRVDLDWSHFAAVTAGYSLIAPRLSRAVPNYQQGVLVCLRQLAARGYRRIGMLIGPSVDPAARFNLLAPFTWYQQELRAAWRVPLFATASGSRRAFDRWRSRHRPEAVIVATREPFIDWLRDGSIRVPENLGVVCTSGTFGAPDYCCIDHQPRRIGAAAVDLLVGQVHRGDFGLSANPKTVFTDVAWSEGQSLRVLRAAVAQPSFDFLA